MNPKNYEIVRDDLRTRLSRIERRINEYIDNNRRHPTADAGVTRMRVTELAKLLREAEGLRREIDEVERLIVITSGMINHNSGKEVNYD